MGNHYANKAGLNHTVPMIICWEELGLLGSLVCSTPGTFFFPLCVFSLSLILHSTLFSRLRFYHFIPRFLNLNPFIFSFLSEGHKVVRYKYKHIL